MKKWIQIYLKKNKSFVLNHFKVVVIQVIVVCVHSQLAYAGLSLGFLDFCLTFQY